MKKNIKYILAFVVFSILLTSIYYFADFLFMGRIRSNITNRYGEDYAILGCHIGGESIDEPHLRQLVIPVLDYNFTDKYKPEGSAGMTGKKYYLTMLISDNQKIVDCHWSFRLLRLVFEEESLPCDFIDNLPKEIVPLYSFDDSSRVERRGLWFAKNCNNEDIKFYYRPTIQGAR